ncbi:MAG: hypothetical protein D6725_00520 [Planctomycetota bacterium]|nr:MAG: hypothetical protein D6725_00520 [Planctomycetota bacterium]
MSRFPDRDFGRSAVALLATTFVTLLGTGFCAAIALFFAEDPLYPLLGVAGTALGIAGLCWVLNRNPRPLLRDVWDWVCNRNEPPPVTVYRVVRRDRPRHPNQFGTNQPPTAERIRMLKQRYWLDPDDSCQTSSDR